MADSESADRAVEPPGRRRPSRGLLIYLAVCAVIAVLAYAGYRKEQAESSMVQIGVELEWAIDNFRLKDPDRNGTCVTIDYPTELPTGDPFDGRQARACVPSAGSNPQYFPDLPILMRNGVLVALGATELVRLDEGTRVVDRAGSWLILHNEDSNPSFFVVGNDGEERHCTTDKTDVLLPISYDEFWALPSNVQRELWSAARAPWAGVAIVNDPICRLVAKSSREET